MPLFDLTYRDKTVRHSIVEARDLRHAELVGKRWVSSREIPTLYLKVTGHVVADESILTLEDKALIKLEDDAQAERQRIEAEKAARKKAEPSKVQPIQRPSV